MLLDIRPDHLQIVQSILQKHVPHYAVWAFGSRAKWTAKDYSDLDLCIVTDTPLGFSLLGAIAEDFSESDLPWKVDIVDWATTSEGFRKIIERDKVVVQKGGKGPGWGRRSESPTVSIGDIAASHRGAMAVGPFGSRMKADLYAPSGVRVIRGNNLSGGKEPEGEYVFVSEKTADSLASCCLKPGDLVFPHRGNIGQVGITPDDGHRYMLSTSLMKLSPDRKKADPLYLMYFFKSSVGRAALLMNASQVGTPGIATPLKSLRSINLPLPPLKTQHEIAETLSRLDDRITLLRETNATLEAIAQALFKSWFVDFDPVHAKQQGRAPQEIPLGDAPEGMDETTAALFPDGFEESELGLVPKGWSMSTLGAICESHSGAIKTGPFGSQLHASDYVSDGTPVVMPKDISGRRIDARTAARIRYEDSERLSRHRLQAGDIVFSRRGDVEKHALIGEQELGWICGTGCLLVRPGSKWNSSGFLSRSLDLAKTKQWLTQHAVGATMPNLNTSIISAVPVLLPMSNVLTVFEDITSVLDKRISENNATAQTLATLRDTLLPRLISGQLRLPDAESIAPEPASTGVLQHAMPVSQ